RADVMIEVERHFRPEFLNRVDELIIFNALTSDDLRRIIDLQLAEVLQRLKDRGVSLTMDQAASDFLIKKGFTEDFGARPLRRAIERFVEDPLAEQLLRAETREGLVVKVTAVEGAEELAFTTVTQPSEPIGATP
ncbi:MAG: NDP-hexose 4-ketoreductase, partial [Planctomycetota bacterium]